MLKYITPLEDIGEIYTLERDKFNTALDSVGKAAQNQTPDTTVITDDIHNDWDDMVAVVMKYAARAVVRAHQAGATELEGGLDKPKTYYGATKQLALNRSIEVKNLMKDNRTVILTNITLDNITEMELEIDTFSGIRGKNKVAVETKKSTGTDVINGNLDNVDLPKGMVGKLVLSYLPGNLAEWEAQIKVGKAAGIRHLDLAMKYVDDETGVVLENVKSVWVLGDVTLIKFSSKLGYNRGYGMTGGNWTLTSDMPGYVQDVKINVGIEDGVIVRYVVRMKKI